MDIIINRGLKTCSVLRSITSILSTEYSTSIRFMSCFNAGHWNVNHFDGWLPRRIVPYNSLLLSNCILRHDKLNKYNIHKDVISLAYSSESKASLNNDPGIPEKKLTVFEKMKIMTKSYWYILIPVHVLTSTVWVVVFYSAATNGVDIYSLMQTVGLSETYLAHIKNSNAGYWAVTYALYKIFTPLRYTVTIGGTTMAVKYMVKQGYIKPAPLYSIAQAKKTADNVESKVQHKTDSKNDQVDSPKT